ncbi:hypothetical protein N5C55_02720 [Pseudomonas otitidis]|uniref:hypothetical protein n=1 Tax=Metapseudomonas otitidis TaxID=319939 RepID=UPI0024472F75|nr:hypothetical protein [Pseudomonas otitidis]MDH1104790.1 hypothetical protein [Pseudomonas otitidis]MDH1157077.1 hypothetical protein [Pseudomonas otitidis]MDH1164701.1 hypothetical protein [Pseudomonas otitidis]
MTFQRESRYIVVKLKDLAPGQEADIREHLTELSAQPVDSLVIERDWPEYEPAWRMIQARVEGAPLSPANIEDGEEVQVVGYSIEGRDEIGVVRIRRLADRPFPEHMQEARDWAGPFNVVSEPLMTVAQHERIAAARVLRMFLRWKTFADEQAQVIAGLQEQLRAALSAPPAADKLRDAVTALSQHLLLVDQSPIAIELVESVKRTLISTPPAAVVPDGYVIVPAELIEHVKHARKMLGGDPEPEYVRARLRQKLTDLLAAPTPPASEQQRAVVMPEKQVEYVGDRDHRQWASGANWMLRELLRLNPHLAKGEGV